MASVAVSDVGRRGLILRKEFQGLQLRSSFSRITCRSVSHPSRCQSGFPALQSSTHQEKLQAALDVVQRACHLCTSVRSSMKGREGQLDKKDNTPVTVADFGVQALISLELGRLFPGIPLVGEENASVLRDNEVWSTSPLASALASGFVGKDVKTDEMQVLPLCCGSLCKYFAVALGGVSAFLLLADRSTPLKVWDHASGVICVSEAGGQVSDLEGTALENLIGNGKEVFTVEGGGIFASNNVLHDFLLTDIQNHTAAVGQ